MKRTLNSLEQVAYIVQVIARLQVSEIARHNLERRRRNRRLATHQTPSNGVVHNISERPARPAGLRLELAGNVLIECQCRAHVMMLDIRHHDINTLLDAVL